MSRPVSSTSAGRGPNDEISTPSIWRRLVSRRAAAMLWRNTVSSSLSFVLGLGALWLLVEQGGADKYLATAISFLSANSVHYALGRWWIFAGSERQIGSGYLFFVLNAAFGLAATMVLFAFFYEVAGLNYLIARIVASIFAGLAMFVSNALLNFKTL